MKKLKGAVILIMFAFAFMACSDQSATSGQAVSSQQQKQQQQQPQETAKGFESTKPESPANVISGTVLHTNSGYTIFTDSGSYRVAGKDLSSVVGKNVRILGTIEETGDAQVINVESIVILE